MLKKTQLHVVNKNYRLVSTCLTAVYKEASDWTVSI